MIGGIETENGYAQFGGLADTLGPNGTIHQKAQFALKNNLAGMMAWRLDNDYADGANPRYPLFLGAKELWRDMLEGSAL